MSRSKKITGSLTIYGLSASWADTFLCFQKLRSVPIFNPWLIPLFQVRNKVWSWATVSQLSAIPEVLQHHIPVESPLARAETLPLFPAEVHSHISEGHRHPAHRWLQDCPRGLAVSPPGTSVARLEIAIASSLPGCSGSEKGAHLKASGGARGRVGFGASAVARSGELRSSMQDRHRTTPELRRLQPSIPPPAALTSTLQRKYASD